MAGWSGVSSFSSRSEGRDAAIEGLRDLYTAGAHVEPTAANLCARVRSRLLPEVVAFDRELDGVLLRRDAAQVRRTGFDHFVLQYVVSGELRLELGDERLVLTSGEAAFADTTRPYSTEAQGCRFYTLSLPRRLLADAGLDVARLHGGAPGLAGAGAARTFDALLHGEGGEDAGVLIDHLVRSATGSTASRCGRSAARERALRFIEAHLHESELTPESVRAGTHLSRATLYRAFAELGGVSGWILTRRVRRLRTALERERRPIADLIGEIGFKSLSHATRAFRNRYGVPPAALRAQRRQSSAESQDPAELTRRLLDDMPSALASVLDPASRAAR